MNIAAYCRVSTNKDDQVHSLEAQKEFFEKYAEKEGHSLVRLYADEGISGTQLKKRKEFLQLMRDARHGLFEKVLVKDISRFARNTVDFLNSIRELKSLNIETEFLSSNQTVLGNSEFILTIFSALAQEESANTSKRIKFSKKLNAEKGKVPNLVYGYDKIIGDYFNLTINESEASIIRRIFNMYVNGGYGANKIAQILNSEGVRTKRDCKWSQNAIARILANELYCGRIINGKQEVEDFLTGIRKIKDETEWMITERPELRIIEQTIFDKAQKTLADRNVSFNTNRERQSNKHLFSTLIKCKCCDYSFRRTERVYQNIYVKWVCSGRNAHGAASCPNTIKIDETELANAIRDYFIGILNSQKDVIKNIVKEFDRVYHTKDANKDYEKELNSKLAKAQKSRKKQMEMYEDDLISREELRERAGTLNLEIERLTNELKLVEYNLSKSDRLEQILDATFTDVKSIISIDHMTNPQLKRVIKKIVVDEHGKVDVFLKLLSDIGLEQSILIDINSNVYEETKHDNSLIKQNDTKAPHRT